MMSSISCLLKSSLMSFKWLTHCSLNWTQICLIIVVLLSIESSDARKHHLNDGRKYFTVSTFGFLTGGTLTVEVKQFSAQPFNKDAVFGLTMAKTMSDSLTPYLDRHEEHCLLLDDVKRNNDDNIGLVSMRLDFKNNKVVFNCNEMLSKLRLFELLGNKPKRSPVANGTDTQTKSKTNKSDDKDIQIMPGEVTKQPNDQKSAPKATEEPKPRIDENNDKKDDKDIKHVEEKVNSDPEFDKPKEIKASVDQPDTKEADKSCSVSSIKLSKSGEEHFEFSFKFQAIVIDELHEGLYSLFFHNCPNYQMGYGHSTTRINLSMFITEQNFDNYLSAGEIPLPQLYFALSVIFFLVGVVWIHVIRNKKNDAFKIHYLMAGLVFVKAFALLFHGINYHFIAKEGSQVETWAILYYITHLLKGALLFITIVLIGTGWAFIKHILSDKDKKIFMIVIPLQVLANIADIIIEESEEGEMMHNMWREIFILVDLLCCGAILFPIVWSIRHLQEASQTDGKAAINLRKLKLFRHFYVMIVCYIYFTRIIVYLLQITMPFQYEWLDIFFRETATLLFFIMTGYHFQPTSTNPYFQLTQEEENEEMEEVLFVQPDNGYSETKKRNRDIEANSDSERLITKRESSHDFD